MPSLPFTKMTGAGNDFVLFDHRKGGPSFSSETIRKICDRRFGVGADGVLMLVRADESGVDCRMQYYNADGGEAEMCGNGARCVAYFLAEEKAPGSGLARFAIQSAAGRLAAESAPGTANACVQLTPPLNLRLNQRITVEGRRLTVHSVNTGVPHVVLWGKKLDQVPVETLGRAIRTHAAFAPAGANVNFATWDPTLQLLGVRTYERGVEAETLACGTGAVATALITHALHGVASPIRVRVRSGDELRIHFKSKAPGQYEEVWLEGPARKVFAGELAAGVI